MIKNRVNLYRDSIFRVSYLQLYNYSTKIIQGTSRNYPRGYGVFVRGDLENADQPAANKHTNHYRYHRLVMANMRTETRMPRDGSMWC